MPAIASAQQIIDGDPAIPADYPATGVITAGKRMRCTGTLIAPDVVLTAAHCAVPAVFGYVSFSLDPFLGDGVTGDVRALVMHQHPDFNPGTEYIDLARPRHDIGIIILEAPIEVPAVEQITAAAPLAAGAPLDLVGYGRTHYAVNSPGEKRTAHVNVDQLAAREFATMPDGPQPCLGDSGGPLFDGSGEGRAVVGVVSRAVGATTFCDTGAIITRTEPYAAWIAEASADRDVGCASAFGLPLLAPLAIGGRARKRRARHRR